MPLPNENMEQMLRKCVFLTFSSSVAAANIKFFFSLIFDITFAYNLVVIFNAKRRVSQVIVVATTIGAVVPYVITPKHCQRGAYFCILAIFERSQKIEISSIPSYIHTHTHTHLASTLVLLYAMCCMRVWSYLVMTYFFLINAVFCLCSKLFCYSHHHMH